MFSNLRLALGMALKCYALESGKRVKTKSQNVFGANSYVCRGYRGKTGRGHFAPSL